MTVWVLSQMSFLARHPASLDQIHWSVFITYLCWDILVSRQGNWSLRDRACSLWLKEGDYMALHLGLFTQRMAADLWSVHIAWRRPMCSSYIITNGSIRKLKETQWKLFQYSIKQKVKEWRMITKKLKFHGLLSQKKTSFYLDLNFPLLTKSSSNGFNKYKGFLQFSKPI